MEAILSEGHPAPPFMSNESSEKREEVVVAKMNLWIFVIFDVEPPGFHPQDTLPLALEVGRNLATQAGEMGGAKRAVFVLFGFSWDSTEMSLISS